jgi:hypothetical protein
MKYALVQTAYSPQKEMVVELYLMPLSAAYQTYDWPHSTLLTDAMIWDTWDDAMNYIESERIEDHKIVEIDDKRLFEARLART